VRAWFDLRLGSHEVSCSLIHDEKLQKTMKPSEASSFKMPLRRCRQGPLGASIQAEGAAASGLRENSSSFAADVPAQSAR
jgi:hypothetical protein